jgi:hypothetical protein
MKLPASTIILTEAKSCNALLRMLLVCTSICLKSVLRYTVLILDTYHPDTIHVREQGLEDPWLFFEAKRGPREKTFGQHCTKLLIKLYICTSIYIYIYGPGSSVGIATGYGLDGPGSNPGGDEVFRASRPAQGRTQPPVKLAPGLSWG